MTQELYKKLTKLQRLLHKQQMRDWAANGPMADTTRGQGRILAMLKLQDGISTKDLSYLLGVRISSLNELLSKLEKGGYIIREPSDQDKRVMLVRLTEKGRNEQQPEPFDSGGIFSCLSDEEQQAFGEYLDRIIAALRATFSNDDDFGPGSRRGFDHDHFRHGRRGGFPGYHGFHGYHHGGCYYGCRHGCRQDFCDHNG